MVKWHVQVTDTEGGQANYSWKLDNTMEYREGESDYSVVRRAKKLMGYNGVRSRTDRVSGDEFRLWFYGVAHVMFVFVETNHNDGG